MYISVILFAANKLTININALFHDATLFIDATVDSLICSINVSYGKSISVDHIFGGRGIQQGSDHVRSRRMRPPNQCLRIGC